MRAPPRKVIKKGRPTADDKSQSGRPVTNQTKQRLNLRRSLQLGNSNALQYLVCKFKSSTNDSETTQSNSVVRSKTYGPGPEASGISTDEAAPISRVLVGFPA